MSDLVIAKRQAAVDAFQHAVGLAAAISVSRATFEEFREAADRYVGAQGSYALASMAEVAKNLP